MSKGLKELPELLLPWFFLQELGYQKLDSLILDVPQFDLTCKMPQ